MPSDWSNRYLLETRKILFIKTKSMRTNKRSSNLKVVLHAHISISHINLPSLLSHATPTLPDRKQCCQSHYFICRLRMWNMVQFVSIVLTCICILEMLFPPFCSKFRWIVQGILNFSYTLNSYKLIVHNLTILVQVLTEKLLFYLQLLYLQQ